MSRESFPGDSSGRRLSIPDVLEALDGLIDPDIVEARLSEWRRQQIESRVEARRYEIACNLVLRYHDYIAQLAEGGLEPNPEPVTKEASQYIALTRERVVVDELDQLLRNVCTMIEASRQRVSSTLEMLMRIHDEISQIRQLLIELGYSVE